MSLFGPVVKSAVLTCYTTMKGTRDVQTSSELRSSYTMHGYGAGRGEEWGWLSVASLTVEGTYVTTTVMTKRQSQPHMHAEMNLNVSVTVDAVKGDCFCQCGTGEFSPAMSNNNQC